MSVKVTDNTPIIQANMRVRSSLFLRFLMDDVESYSTPITPKKEGRLRESILKRVLGLHGTMRWQKVYAAPQERGTIKGRPIRNYTTPGTGPDYALRGVQKAVIGAEKSMRKAGLIQ